jgi:hypothetical protein
VNCTITTEMSNTSIAEFNITHNTTGGKEGELGLVSEGCRRSFDSRSNLTVDENALRVRQTRAKKPKAQSTLTTSSTGNRGVGARRTATARHKQADVDDERVEDQYVDGARTATMAEHIVTQSCANGHRGLSQNGYGPAAKFLCPI